MKDSSVVSAAKGGSCSSSPDSAGSGRGGMAAAEGKESTKSPSVDKHTRSMEGEGTIYKLSTGCAKFGNLPGLKFNVCSFSLVMISL